jgi:ribonuclease T2
MNRNDSAVTFAAVLVTSIFALASAANAQRYAPRNNDRQQHIAGKFDYYQLVLSWSPTHCADNSRGENDTQCGRRRARPYSFVLHGLWPQYERGWPEFCRTRGKPFVPNNIITSMMDIMPSRGLIIHQYKKHGSCSGLDTKTYFKASRIAYRNVRIPKTFAAPKKPLLMTPAELVSKFRSVNPTLTNDAIQVVCKRGNANRLKEVKFCMTRKGAFRACIKGRTPRHRCANRKMYIPPVRL